MGIYDRNYFRGSSGGWGSGPGSWPPVCKAIVLINVGVFIAQIMLTRPPTMAEVSQNPYGFDAEYEFVEDYIASHLKSEDTDVTDGQDHVKPDSASKETPTSRAASDDDAAQEEKLRLEAERRYHEHLVDLAAVAPRVSVVQQWLQLDTAKVKQGQIWRVLTSAFCHDRHSLLHILFNMLGLIWFGIALEYMYGSREFLLFYLSAAILSGLAYVGLDLWTGESVPAIGASGAVMGVLMLFACHYPNYTIRIWFFFPLEMRWLVLLYVAFDLHPLLLALSGDQVHTGVAHAAHLGGLAFGYVYWHQRLRLSPLVDFVQNLDLGKTFRRSSKMNLKLHSPPKDGGVPRTADATDRSTVDSDRLDELLIKISREGRDNLTAEELEMLNAASDRLRNKKK